MDGGTETATWGRGNARWRAKTCLGAEEGEREYEIFAYFCTLRTIKR